MSPSRMASVESIMSAGLALEAEYQRLRQVLQVPPEMISSSAQSSVRGLFEKAVQLWAQIDAFQIEENRGVALAISPSDTSGQGQVLALMPMRRVLVSQKLARVSWAREADMDITLHVTKLGRKLDEFRETKVPCIPDIEREPYFYVPQQSWRPASRFTRVKLLERGVGEHDTSLLNMDDNGYVNVTSSNGFFFVGFLQFPKLGVGLSFEDILKQPSSFNDSIPAFTVVDLQWRLTYALALVREREREDQNSLEDSHEGGATNDKGWRQTRGSANTISVITISEDDDKGKVSEGAKLIWGTRERGSRNDSAQKKGKCPAGTRDTITISEDSDMGI